MASDRHRALIVDDESAILRLTAAALRKQGFECDLAEDGNEAERMATSAHYDVVVTDLKMPNKNGHAFALDVLRQENRPLIIVHTGIIEPKLANDLLARGVDDIVFKPADFSILASKVKVLVQRRAQKNVATANQHLGRAPMTVSSDIASADTPVTLWQLNDKLAEVATVLPVSNAALGVYEMAHSDQWGIPQIAAAIQRDASLTTEILRLANNTLYNGSGRRILCLEEAILRIGQRRVGELALAANALAALTPVILPWMNLELTWRRSMAAGIAMESLIELGEYEAIEEGLLLSAIMHPLGRVVLGMLFPEHYGAMMVSCQRTGDPLCELERQMFPTSHPEIMAHLLASWRIPSDVFLPLKYSMEDFAVLGRLSEPMRTKTELVKLAIVLGRLAVGRWESWDLVQLPPLRVLKRLCRANVHSVIEQIRADLAKLADFHPGKIPINPHTDVLAAEHVVAYCNPSESEHDLLVELLPSMGLRASRCAVDKLQHPEGPAIINCLGVAFGRLAGFGRLNKSIIIADQDSREIFESFGETAALPESYGRFREIVLNVVFGQQSAERKVVAMARC